MSNYYAITEYLPEEDRLDYCLRMLQRLSRDYLVLLCRHDEMEKKYTELEKVVEKLQLTELFSEEGLK